MKDRKEPRSPLDRLGPFIFLILLVLIIEFFWWFMHA